MMQVAVNPIHGQTERPSGRTRTMDVVVPFGFYGWGNIGDESTLQGFARLTAAYSRATIRASVASRNPVHTALIEPSFRYYDATSRNFGGWWARRLTDVFLFAGGTPIMDILGEYPLADVVPIVTTGHRRNKRIVFVGVGTERLHRSESIRTVAEILAPRVRHWSVRSEADKRRLEEYEVDPAVITVAADMAWLLDPVSPAWGAGYLKSLGIDPAKPLVGVNVNREPFMQRVAPHLLQHVGTLLDELIERDDVTVLFLCNDVSDGETYDRAASAMVRGAMKRADRAFIIPNHYWSPQNMLSLIANCRVTISSRYHFCLFSALQTIPFIALQRSDKVRDLCEDLGWAQGVPIQDADARALQDLYDRTMRESRSDTELLQDGVLRMRRRASRNHAALDALV